MTLLRLKGQSRDALYITGTGQEKRAVTILHHHSFENVMALATVSQEKASNGVSLRSHDHRENIARQTQYCVTFALVRTGNGSQSKSAKSILMYQL